MAVETTAGGMSITGDHIEMFRFMTVMRGMALDIRGIKPTRGFSSIKLAAQYGIKARTKKQALEGMVALMREANPEWEVPASIKQTLES